MKSTLSVARSSMAAFRSSAIRSGSVARPVRLAPSVHTRAALSLYKPAQLRVPVRSATLSSSFLQSQRLMSSAVSTTKTCKHKACDPLPKSALAQIPRLLSSKSNDAEEEVTKRSNEIKVLLDNNKEWAANIKANDPGYFERLAQGQTPKYFVISCSDSRVPISAITSTNPGDVFSHRNVANVVSGTDFNLLSCLQYAVEVLKVNHVIVIGHYECGGVKAAMSNLDHGLAEHWLRNIRDVARLHDPVLSKIKDPDERYRKLIDLNVHEQVLNVWKTSTLQRRRKETLAYLGTAFPKVHGLVYDIKTGLLNQLQTDVSIADHLRKYNHIYQLY